MKSVVIPVTTLNVGAIHNLIESPALSSEQTTSDEVQYSELPGTLMLGVDGSLRPLFHGPDTEYKKFI